MLLGEFIGEAERLVLAPKEVLVRFKRKETPARPKVPRELLWEEWHEALLQFLKEEEQLP
jgi:hypothetical protein